MGNQHRVCWLHHSKVYHRANYRATGGPASRVPCGTVVWCFRFRAQEGTALEARRLGLRPCARCFKP